ncbi:MAG: histidinol dehydrogenase [Lactobacillales bacterium]|jgi:histidinol dehydrogenase|nr:histidinol dehydrogenase [Lactobacillales bacterium]
MRYLEGEKSQIIATIAADARESDSGREDIEAAVAAIIADVIANGDDALRKYAKQFDNVEITDLAVSTGEIDAAFERVDKDLVRSLEKAKANIESYHKLQVKEGFKEVADDGVIRGQLVLPLERVGIYVPGGTAAYPSSVLMNALPAKIAGVEEIIMVTPPGTPDVILAAAKIAGVDKIYRVGGAQAVAALAYGTESIPKVDKIVGPGNVFVATAKKQVYGKVSIDMIAGPSEIGVIADDSANPEFIAADLLSQAEHDKLARAILVTTSRELATKVEAEVEKQLKVLPREEIAREAIEKQGIIVIANDFDEMFEIMNELAPEHLEVQVDNAIDYLGRIKHAGSIFLGHYTSESVGDYFAGTNHVLPTNGTARFYSPLGVYDFIKHTEFTYYTRDALVRDAEDITRIARFEGLEAHARSVEVRL